MTRQIAIQNNIREFRLINILIVAGFLRQSLLDQLRMANFSSSSLVFYTYEFTLLLVVYETIFSGLIFLSPDMPNLIDFDLTMVTGLWLMGRLFQNLKTKKLYQIINLDVGQF